MENFGKVFYKLNKIGSTNVFLQNLVKKGEIMDGMAVIARHQTAGKGQRGNQWHDEAGQNLAMSIYVEVPFLKAKEGFYLNMAVALSICECLRSLTALDVLIKWPNDLYYDGKKIGGILIENTLTGNNLNTSIIGIGLNVNQLFFPENLPNPSSLKLETGREYDVELLGRSICAMMDKYFSFLRTGNFDHLKKVYLKWLYQFEEQANYQIEEQVIPGIITGINEAGMLVLKMPNDEERHFNLKEIRFL